MQGHSVKVLVVFIVLLAFAGCKHQPSQLQSQSAPAPAQESDRPPTPTPTTTILNAEKGLLHFEVHTALAPGSTVLWHYKSEFNVQFNPNHNPCEPHKADNFGPDTYGSHPSKNGDTNEVTCTIAPNSPPNVPPFRYKIEKTSSSKSKTPAPPSHSLFDSHCRGCVIDK